MNRWITTALVLSGAIISSCTRPVHVTALEASSDYKGLVQLEEPETIRAREWAAIGVTIPASVARSIRRWQLSNTVLSFSRCGKPKDTYPAYLSLDGRRFDYRALRDPLPSAIKLTVYLPRDVEERGRYDCASLDARGYSPVALRGQEMRLPTLRYARVRTGS